MARLSRYARSVLIFSTQTSNMFHGFLKTDVSGLQSVSGSSPDLKRYLIIALDILLILIIGVLITIKTKELFNVDFILLTAATIYILKNIFLDESWKRMGRLNLLDVSLGIVVVCEIINYFASTYRPNSFLFLDDVLFLFVFYWLIRFNLERDYQRTVLFLFLALGGLILAGAAFYYFWQLQGRLRELGFHDVTNFRNYIYFLNPIGLPVGVWSSVLLLLLPFPLILVVKYRCAAYARRALTLVSVAILLALLMTFIRGIYIALFMFFVIGSTLCWRYGLFSLRRIASFNLTILVLVLIGLLPVARPALTTLSLFKTTSQVRSFEGRTKIWQNSLKMAREHPWFGVGSNNFTLQYMAYQSQGDDSAFALRPFNTVLHVLTEKGGIGLLAYAFLCFSFLLVSHQKIKRLRGDVYQKYVVVLFVAIFLSLMARDLSESSIFTSKGVAVLLIFIFACNAQSLKGVADS
jgi:O-antigen ligase